MSVYSNDTTRVLAFTARVALAVGVVCAVTLSSATTASAVEVPFATTQGSIKIQAVDVDGQPLPGALIHASFSAPRPAKPGRYDGRCDEAGMVVIDLPERVRLLRVWASLEGEVPLFAQWDPDEQPDVRSIPEQFTFVLERGTVIGGIVKDEDGKPIQGATVEVRLEPMGLKKELESRPVVNSRLAYGNEPPYEAQTTDEEGRWSLNNVPAGDDVKLRVSLSHPDYISASNWGAAQQAKQGITLESLRAQMAIIVMRRGLSITGTVRDPAGKPVPQAVIAWRSDRHYQSADDVMRTDEQGVYRLPPLPAAPDRLRVTVIAKGYSPEMKSAQLDAEPHPLDFELQPGNRLRIRCVDPRGEAIPDVAVWIESWRGDDGSLYNGKEHRGIPRSSNGNGVFEWTWAPADVVTYQFSKPGYAWTEANIVAGADEHVQVLHPVLRLSGRVSDARTGQTIDEYEVVPVIYFRPDFLFVHRDDAVKSVAGDFAIEFDRTDIKHGVRFEAPGYRTQIQGPWEIGDAPPSLDVALEPAPPIRGIVRSADGYPLEGVEVYLGTHTQHLDLPNYEDPYREAYVRTTDARGRFTFPAQYEPYMLIAVHEIGCAETSLAPDEQPGELMLRPWARVEGRLLQAGEPIAGERVRLAPLRPRFYPEPRIGDSFWTTTDHEGRYVFERVPPVKCALQAQLGVWEASALTSSEAVPLHLRPGEQLQVDLGGRAGAVVGKVALSGEAAREIDLNYSLNYLLDLRPGVEPSPAVAAKGFDWRQGWTDAWTNTVEGQAYQQTLHHYFVKLGRDGTFRVSGVPAGEYELAFKIYEHPGDGCLVSPAGRKALRFQMSEADVAAGTLDLGTIEIEASLGPKVGELVPDFEFENAAGGTQRLSDLRGKLVLLDVWATWCASCVAELPELKEYWEASRDGDSLAVLSVSLDADRQQARDFIAEHGLSWAQGFLGDWSQTPVPAQLGISSVPAYFLIAPDGTLLYRGHNLEEVCKQARSALQTRASPAAPLRR